MITRDENVDDSDNNNFKISKINKEKEEDEKDYEDNNDHKSSKKISISRIPLSREELFEENEPRTKRSKKGSTARKKRIIRKPKDKRGGKET